MHSAYVYQKRAFVSPAASDGDRTGVWDVGATTETEIVKVRLFPSKLYRPYSHIVSRNRRKLLRFLHSTLDEIDLTKESVNA